MRTSSWLLVIAAIAPATCATRSLLLGDAERGTALFQSLNCIVCQSVSGVGGAKAPDLGQGRERGFSPYNMAALMWNHAPAMWGAMARQGVARPALDEQQAADLFVFFYAAGYFETPGTPGAKDSYFLPGAAGNGTESILPSVRAFGRSPNGTRSGTPSPSPSRCGTIPATWRARSTGRKSPIHCSPRRN